ncbi:MAG TPA: fumarate hydratase, partial [Candidatus Methylomirabilis sp.]
MREIETDQIVQAVKEMCLEANYDLGPDMMRAFGQALEREESPIGQEVLRQLIENANIARQERVPMCQDCGVAMVFAEIGQDVHIAGGYFLDAINEGVRQGYQDGYLRKSILNDPIHRVNTKDNTPAVIHLEMVTGDRLKLIVAPKGGGAENMIQMRMLKPSDGVEGIKGLVLETVAKAGPNPCPPIILGVGIGGTFEKAALISKKALFRKIGTPHPDPDIAALEKDLLEAVNALGIGPLGFGGRVTALAVHA